MINLTQPSMPLPLNPAEVKRALVLVPHPDDEAIGCGGLLAALASSGVAVRVVLVSDGSGAGGLPEGAAAVRFQEFLASLQVLGASISHEAWNLPDGGLSDCPMAMDSLLTESLANFEPSVLIAPWLYDLHPDHAAVGQLAVRAHQQLKFNQGVLFYEVWSPLPANRFLNINAVFQTKLAALKCHATALECGSYDRAVEGLAVYRSLFAGKLAAEGEYAEAYYALDWAVCPNVTSARYATVADAQSVCELHDDVFSSQVKLAWWQWKYTSQALIGTVFEDQGEVVGFYGALERIGLWQGKAIAVSQQADVMVEAKHRFGTRRQGVFSRMSRLLLKEHLGQNKRYQLCFGFPTIRALHLGIRLGLYRRADEVFIANKQLTQLKKLPFGVYSKQEQAAKITCFAWLNTLPVHSPPTDALFSLKKGASYWQWRFAKHVDKHYQIIRVSRWGRLLGAAVVLQSADTLEIIDFALSDWQHLELLLQAIGNTCVDLALRQISVWGTRQVVEALSFPNPDAWINAGYLALPGEKLDATLSDEIEGSCWFVGGDTDFR